MFFFLVLFLVLFYFKKQTVYVCVPLLFVTEREEEIVGVISRVRMIKLWFWFCVWCGVCDVKTNFLNLMLDMSLT